MFVTRHPLQLFVILLMFVFAGEVGIMFLFDAFEDFHRYPWLEAFSDAALLTSLCAPFFWYYFLVPLQSALRLESFKSHMIVEMAAEGIISIDTKGSIQSFNRAAQRIFGYGEEEVLGRNVSLLMPPPYRDDHDGYLARYLQTGQAHIIGKTRELQGLRKDGTVFPMELAVTEVKLGDTHLFTAMLRDISEQKLVQQRIEQLAHYDALTHLPNRSLFYDRLGQSLMMAKRNQRSIALLYVDLDGFKQVNDTLGHHIGDLLLEKVAERLRLCVRESDTLARLGGDEFTLVLNDTHEREAVAMVAGKVIESIAAPFDVEGHKVGIGASIGIARYPDDAGTMGALLIVADKAMYAAKAAGKNTYLFGVPGDATTSFQAMDRGV
ncbi:MAG TPA: diguanylate cyclase [Gallionella sp.]|nr:diguanylate cyclase [Gallionella sp.]